MFFTNTTFLGIDPTAGHKPFSYAALDGNRRLLALGQGSIEEVLAFAAGQSQALAAVCAPRRPNQRLMERESVREQLSPPPRPGRWVNFRLAEYQMRQRHISTYKTPSLEQDCPTWMQMGFNLYRRLEAQGYQPYPNEGQALQWLEVYPHASYCVLLGQAPLPKNTFEGRIQRQLALYQEKLDIPDPMRLFEEITRHRLLQGILPTEQLYLPGELDALVAAYTAWLVATHPERTTRLGDPEESLVILPAAELKRRY
jgi:Protein of unknown function (DUF429)